MKIPIILPAAMWAVIASIVLQGCSSKPIDELKMVGIAKDHARSAGAAEYAPLDYDRAQMQWEEASALIQMGRYGEARGLLTQAVGNFNVAKDKADRRVESLKLEIAALKSSTANDLKQLERDSESSKLKPSARRRIDAALPRIDEEIATMNAALDEKEYLRSRMAGQNAEHYLQDLRARMGLSQ